MGSRDESSSRTIDSDTIGPTGSVTLHTTDAPSAMNVHLAEPYSTVATAGEGDPVCETSGSDDPQIELLVVSTMSGPPGPVEDAKERNVEDPSFVEGCCKCCKAVYNGINRFAKQRALTLSALTLTSTGGQRRRVFSAS